MSETKEVEVIQNNGRPTSLDEKLIHELTTLIKMGVDLKNASRACGVHREVVYMWLRKGQQESAKTIYAKFYAEFHKAVGESAVRDVSVVYSAAQGRDAVYAVYPPGHKKAGEIQLDKKGNPILLRPAMRPSLKAAMWKLERRFPEEWGPRFIGDPGHVPEEAQGQTRDVGGDDHQKRMERIQSLIEKAKQRDEP